MKLIEIVGLHKNHAKKLEKEGILNVEDLLPLIKSQINTFFNCSGFQNCINNYFKINFFSKYRTRLFKFFIISYIYQNNTNYIRNYKINQDD